MPKSTSQSKKNKELATKQIGPPAVDPQEREAQLARMAHARQNNVLNNPRIAEELQAKEPVETLRPHLDVYLKSVRSVKDFERLRRENPLKALEFATERIWAGKTGALSPRNNRGIAVLIKVLTGHQAIPEGDSPPQHIVVEAKSDVIPDRDTE